MTKLNYFFIRVSDIIISSLSLIVFSPFFLILTVTILLIDGRPIIFKQIRIGRNLSPFTIYKFRSMTNTTVIHNSSSNRETISTKPNDVRITKLGKILRKTSIDELPQLYNIFLGDMSIVGPRPDTPAQHVDYPKEIWIKRHFIKPGLTGLAQISGRSEISLEDRIKLDISYVENVNLSLYYKIVFKTMLVIFSSNNKVH